LLAALAALIKKLAIVLQTTTQKSRVGKRRRTTDGRHCGADYGAARLATVCATIATLCGAPVPRIVFVQASSSGTDITVQEHLHAGRYREAFALLLPHYRSKVFRLCYGILQQHAWAEDVSQDVFLRIWRALPGFAGQSSLSTWIYAISRNACLSELRKRRMQVSIDDADGSIHSQTAGFAVCDADDSATVSVKQMLDRLPHRYREAVTLFYMEDRSYEQTAASLGMPLGTVKALLHRARKRLIELARQAA
jgi:RNA polymerase sigma-70 factor (ECF subfamily)